MLAHASILRSAFGFCALIQIVFLPGYLLVRSMRWSNGALQTLLLSFGMSLLLNFYMVMMLVAMDLYTTGVVLWIFTLEVAAALLWARQSPSEKWISDATRLTRAGEALWRGSWLLRTAKAVAVLLAVRSIALAAMDVTQHWGDIFSVWDEVTSWNRWALDWANNHWPERTMSYPQLLPANLSLTYLFIDTENLWVFAKAVMPLFPLAILLLLTDLALRTDNYGYVIAIPITDHLLQTVLGPVRLLGYADGPLAFLLFTGLYCCVLAREEASTPSGHASRTFTALPALAAAAALTKVSGWFAGLAFALLVWLWRRERPAAAEAPANTRWLGRWLTIALLLPLPWYALSELHLVSSVDRKINMKEVLVYAHRDRDTAERVQHGCAELARNGGVPGVFFLCLSLVALADKAWRPVTVLGFAWTAVWALGLSYDARNLAPAVPFLGLAAGMGAVAVLAQPTRARIALALLAACASLAIVYPAKALAADQAVRQQRIGIRDVNDVLLKYMDSVGFSGPVLSNYNFMPYHPRLRRYFIHEYFHDLELFRANLAATKAHYLLYSSEWCDAEIQNWIEQRIKSGEFDQIAPIGLWKFIRVAPATR